MTAAANSATRSRGAIRNEANRCQDGDVLVVAPTLRSDAGHFSVDHPDSNGAVVAPTGQETAR